MALAVRKELKFGGAIVGVLPGVEVTNIVAVCAIGMVIEVLVDAGINVTFESKGDGEVETDTGNTVDGAQLTKITTMNNRQATLFILVPLNELMDSLILLSHIA